jgi:AcrR family transcriptional regulator
MTTRAVAAAETPEKILSATIALLAERPVADITLSGIAEGSGVSVQTVLRRFGDKDSVLAAAIARFAREVFAHRGQAEPGELGDIVANLLEHYERWGGTVLKMLEQQSSAPTIGATVEGGQHYHRDWCARVFAGSLIGLTSAEQERKLAQFVAICDLRTWESLRLTTGLSRSQTETALREMLGPLMGEPR